MLHQPRETPAYFYLYLSSKKRHSYLQSRVLKVMFHWYYIEISAKSYYKEKYIYNLTTKQQTVGLNRELDTINYIVIFRKVPVEII